MARLTVEYDCGYVTGYPVALGDAQTLLHQPALGDTMLLLADADHDANCKECA